MNGVEKIKSQICDEKIKVVSFDIFDTLVLRPVFKPADLFVLMGNDFRKLVPDCEHTFIVIRLAAEKSARMNSENGEVTIDDIYNEMSENYNIDSKIADTLKETEIKLEIQGCYARKTAKILFDTAVENNKKIVLNADMYLSSDVIIKILDKIDYKGYDNIYISCELNKNKKSGSMYQHILEQYKVSASEILHIGDDYASDIEQPRKLGIQCCYMPAPSELMKNTVLSSCDERIYFEARCNLMAFANNYFDDPFRKDFNEDVLNKRQSDDGLAEKINSILPVGSKKRKFAENIASKILGK